MHTVVRFDLLMITVYCLFRLLSSVVDILITHPNVLNGAMLSKPMENVLYVEGQTAVQRSIYNPSRQLLLYWGCSVSQVFGFNASYNCMR